MLELWPWLTVAGLGVHHGLNPATGWPFALALGLHHQSRSVMLRSLLPIAAGHLASVAVVASLVVILGVALPQQMLRQVAGGALVLCALLRLLAGNGRRLRIGVETGLTGLLGWSFVMATAHGAGLMVIPALIPLCGTDSPAADSFGAALAVVGLHTAAMLAGTALMAGAAWRFSSGGQSWMESPALWSAILLLSGAILLATA